MSDTFTFEIKSRRDSDTVVFTADLDVRYQKEPRSIQVGAAIERGDRTDAITKAEAGE